MSRVGGSPVGFRVEVAPIWEHWGNGGSKIGPHMIFIWIGECPAFGGKPYKRVGVGLDTSQWCCAKLTVV